MKNHMCHLLPACVPRGLCVVLSQTQDDQSEETHVRCACGKEGVVSRNLSVTQSRRSHATV
jgi:hypothetical protein